MKWLMIGIIVQTFVCGFSDDLDKALALCVTVLLTGQVVIAVFKRTFRSVALALSPWVIFSVCVVYVYRCQTIEKARIDDFHFVVCLSLNL